MLTAAASAGPAASNSAARTVIADAKAPMKRPRPDRLTIALMTTHPRRLIPVGISAQPSRVCITDATSAKRAGAQVSIPRVSAKTGPSFRTQPAAQPELPYCHGGEQAERRREASGDVTHRANQDRR